MEYYIKKPTHTYRFGVRCYNQAKFSYSGSLNKPTNQSKRIHTFPSGEYCIPDYYNCLVQAPNRYVPYIA